MTEEIREKLARLTGGERKVLDAYCDLADQTQTLYAAIARELNRSEGTIKNQMHVVFSKLELRRLPRNIKRERLLEEFCPVLEEGNIPEPPPEPDTLPELSQEELEEVEELGFPIVRVGQVVEEPNEEDGEKPIVIVEPPRPQRRWRWRIVSALLGLLFGVAMWEFLLRPEQPIRPALATTIIQTVEVEVPVVITTTPEPTQPFPTQVAEGAFDEAPATPQPLTETPTAISTITATATPSLQLPFEDDFSQDIGPEWKIVDGEYSIENGQLGSATNWLTLEIGDTALGSKYTVEFDYDGVQNLFVTVAGKLRHYSLRYGSKWQARQDNNWVNIGSASGKGFSGSMRLTVDGNFYSVYLSYRDYTGPTMDSLDTIIYGEALQGPLSIRFSKGLFIDNFSITTP